MAPSAFNLYIVGVRVFAWVNLNSVCGSIGRNTDKGKVICIEMNFDSGFSEGKIKQLRIYLS